MNPLVLISTSGSRKKGFSLIRRSLWLSETLKKDLGYEPHWIVNQDEELKTLLEQKGIRFTRVSNSLEEKQILKNTPARFLVVDRGNTEGGFYANLPYPVLGIDNCGPDRSSFDYTLDILPDSDCPESNFKGQKYMILPGEFWEYQRPRMVRPIKKILVTFGDTDTPDLALIMKEVFERIKEPFQISFVPGIFYRGRLKALQNRLPAHIQILPPQEPLYPLMKESDLVITSFSITAYESLFLGVPVFLVNPSEKAEGLSVQAGIPGGGVGQFKKIEALRESLVRFIANPYFPPLESPPKENLTLKLVLKTLLNTSKTPCPACGKTGCEAVRRDGFFNLFYCEKDRIFFRSAGYQAKMAYSSNYFVEDYKRQYGKTYEEDRPNIDRLNRDRMNTLINVLPPIERKRNLLEVGCALGFFLDMAEKTGRFDPEGIEISSYAADYARHKLGLKVTRQDFLKTVFPFPYYDVVAMWYYLEHNKNFTELVARIKEALKIGGVLALSTPNAHGISARKNRKTYGDRIPEDHYFEFSPVGLTACLEKEGFRLIQIKTTGIHPRRWVSLPFSFLDPFIRWVMKKRRLGDTFEAYYERIR